MQKTSNTLFWGSSFLFLIGFVAVFDFKYNYLPEPSALGAWFMGEAASSDTDILYKTIGILLAFSFLLASVWNRFVLIWKAEWIYWIQTAIVYYLALQLWEYGCDKVFKAQFYLPEPNILYTPVGELSPDILYWTSMGTSWRYSFFMGGAECLAGLLLLLRKTRLLGLLLSVGVFINVIAVNVGFDISVKLYSAVLLLFTLIALRPYFAFLYGMLIHQDKRAILLTIPKSTKKIGARVLKWLTISLILVESAGPYVFAGRINDDTVPRPKYHGAYTITNSSQVQYAFVHRKGYFIIRNQKGQMKDYKLELDQENNQFRLLDYQVGETWLLKYQARSGILLHLGGTLGGREIDWQLKPLEYQSLPALRNAFHWTIEHE